MRETSLDEWVGGDGEEEDGSEAEGSRADGSEEVEREADESEEAESEAGAGAGDGSEAGAELEDGVEATAEPDDVPEPDAVEPAVSTYDWTPGGAACAACGAAVERRWRDDDGLVCTDCKAW